MDDGMDLEQFDFVRFARSIERACQEGVKWERRKLQWVLDERQKQLEATQDTA